MPAMEYERLYRLRYGIELLFSCVYGPFFSDIPNALAEAVTYLKSQKSNEGAQLYTGGAFISESFDRGKVPVKGVYLSHPPDENGDYIAVDQWLEAVIEGFSIAQTIDDLYSRPIFYPPSWERKSDGPVSVEELLQCNTDLSFGPEGWVAEALSHVNDPLGRFRALAVALRHRTGLKQEG